MTIGFQLWTPSYFIRVQGWDPARTGVVLGITQILAATTLPLHGAMVDRLFRGGRRDAHLFWCFFTVLAAAPCGVAAFLAGDARLTVLLFGLFMGLVLSTASMGPALVQVVTPPHLRGRVSAVYVLVTGLLAMAVGPAAVGFITDRVLGDPLLVGRSLMLTVGLLLVPAIGFLWLGRVSMRTRLA